MREGAWVGVSSCPGSVQRLDPSRVLPGAAVFAGLWGRGRIELLIRNTVLRNTFEMFCDIKIFQKPLDFDASAAQMSNLEWSVQGGALPLHPR